MQKEKLKRILHESGLKATECRISVLESLIDSKTPKSHREVYNDVEESGVDRVSVYRALHSFIKTGIAHKIDNGDRTWRFAYCKCGFSIHCHPHFSCRICGKVECLQDKNLPELINLNPGYRIEGQELYIHGICPACNAKESK